MLSFNRVVDTIYASIEAMKSATGVLTSDNTNVSDGDTVTIGSQTYTFKTTLTDGSTHAGEVHIGASADASLTNLASAINGTGTRGTDYDSSTPVNTKVTSGAVSSHAITVTATVAGQAGNNIATTETSAHLSWGDATLDGGSGGVIKDYFLDSAGSVNTDAINVQAYNEAIAFIKVYSHAGTTPTLDCKIQYSHNYDPILKTGDWIDSGDAFTQITTTNGVSLKKLTSNFGKYIRFVLTLGGTTPQYETDVVLLGKL